jgi:hypothetical protein
MYVCLYIWLCLFTTMWVYKYVHLDVCIRYMFLGFVYISLTMAVNQLNYNKNLCF